MSNKFWVFGTQFDAAMVQALERHEKQRSQSERERERERHARRTRRDKARRQNASLSKGN